MEDSIVISQLELTASIGVSESERAVPQRLTISLRLIPLRRLTSLNDSLSGTVDYSAVCEAVLSESASRPRRLIETLAEDVANLLLGRFPLLAVEVEVRKYILPATSHIAVRILREIKP